LSRVLTAIGLNKLFCNHSVKKKLFCNHYFNFW